MKRFLGMMAVLSMSACAILESPVPATPTAALATAPTNIPTSGLTSDASTFSYDSLVGKPAPAFTAPDANGQSYTFTPNDGRKHVIVFNMGFA